MGTHEALTVKTLMGFIGETLREEASVKLDKLLKPFTNSPNFSSIEVYIFITIIYIWEWHDF